MRDTARGGCATRDGAVRDRTDRGLVVATETGCRARDYVVDGRLAAAEAFVRKAGAMVPGDAAENRRLVVPGSGRGLCRGCRNGRGGHRRQSQGHDRSSFRVPRVQSAAFVDATTLTLAHRSASWNCDGALHPRLCFCQLPAGVAGAAYRRPRLSDPAVLTRRWLWKGDSGFPTTPEPKTKTFGSSPDIHNRLGRNCGIDGVSSQTLVAGSRGRGVAGWRGGGPPGRGVAGWRGRGVAGWRGRGVAGSRGRGVAGSRGGGVAGWRGRDAPRVAGGPGGRSPGARPATAWRITRK